MRSSFVSSAVLALAVALSSSARADPRPGSMPEMSREQRAQMLKKLHTGFIVELGELLELDTAGTVKLADKLKKYDEQRIQLRLDQGDTMDALRKAAKQPAGVDAAALARKLAQGRIQLAQVDQAEMEEIFKQVPADKIAKVAVFMAEYPRRVERVARELQRERFIREHGQGGGE
jgi:hypothetical protein